MEDGVIYNNNRTMLHSWLYRDGVTDFTVPGTVRTINSYAFSNGLQNITLPEGLTRIGSHSMPITLRNVNIPSTLLYIESYAFSKCRYLSSITLNENLHSIEAFAFEECNGLTEIVIPVSVTDIGQGAFYKCGGLRNVTMYSGAYTTQLFSQCTSLETAVIYNSNWIGNSMFEGCTALSNVTMHDGVLNIMGNAFRGCTSLTHVDLPSQLSIIGTCAFENCTQLTNLEFPALLGTIGGHAFSGCGSITNVVLPDFLYSIGTHAFAGCLQLTEIVLPAKLRQIGADIFDACPLLSSVVWNVRNGSDATRGNGPLYSIREQITSFTFGNEVEHVPAYLLEGMQLLTSSFTLPSTVRSIGAGAFKDCGNLRGVNMTDNVTELGDSVFYNCGNLESVTLSDNIDSIGDYTFYKCRNMNSVNVPSALTYVGKHAFEQCVNMTSFLLHDGVSDIGDFAFYMWNSTPNSMLSDFRLPETLTHIGEQALSGCHRIDSLYIGANVTELSKRVFDSMTSLRKVIFADNSQLQHIGEFVFRQCSNLKYLDIPAGVDSIAAGAFADCTALREITIPENVRVIETVGSNNIATPFAGCTRLKKVYWLAHNCADFNENTPFYKHSTFGGDDITLIDTIVFGSNVEHIPAKLCYKMSRLRGIEFPASVTSIGNEAFSGCTALDSLICHVTEPIAVNANVFDGVNRPSTTLYLPFSAVMAYRTTDVWKDFDIKILPQDEYSGKCGETAVWTYTDATRTLRIHGTGAMTYNTEYEVFASDVDTLIIDRDITSIRTFIEYEYEYENEVWGAFWFKGMFDDLVNLKKIVWNARNATGEYSYEDDFFISFMRNNSDKLESFVFGADVEAVPNKICIGMDIMRNVILPEGVISIGDYAFSYCQNLESLSLPSTLLSIGKEAFEGCAQLRAIALPEGLETLGDKAFKACSNLESINWPSTITGVGNYIFSECFSLRTLPEGITTLSEGMFLSCTSLEEVSIPEGITTLPSNTFTLCPAIRRIELPSSLTLIGDYAFYGPIALEQVICHAITPPTLGGESVFTDDSYSDDSYSGVSAYAARLSVPCVSERLYREHSVWGRFAEGECLEETSLNNVENDTSGISFIDGVLLNPNRLMISVYNTLGQRVYNGNESNIHIGAHGVYCVTGASVNRKNSILDKFFS